MAGAMHKLLFTAVMIIVFLQGVNAQKLLPFKLPDTGQTDWRVPNVKEIQSLNNVALFKPSFEKTYFPDVLSGNFWTSTTLIQATEKAWDINIDYGIVSYNVKTLSENVLLVRGGLDNSSLNINEVHIPGGEYEMGDHFGFVDPHHPSDELPVHLVSVDSFNLAK
ncbi:MAG: DUF1566 domain-containing protein, partial [Bacteroidetes bacterium]|nr:DUF1566 domain-containing protein [Bacteroidota bacterium]